MATEVECLGVRLSELGIRSKVTGSLFIPRDDIRRIVCRWGYQAERPVAQFVAAVVTILPGLWPILHAGYFILYGGTIYPVKEGSLLLFLVLGFYLAYDAFKRGTFLEVHHAKTHHKIPFTGEPDDTTLAEFLRGAANLGYQIEVGGDRP